MSLDQPYDLFLSYARTDLAWAKRFAEALITASRDVQGGPWRVFVDTEELSSLDYWRNRLLSEVEHCHAFVAVLSPGYMESYRLERMCFHEYESAATRELQGEHGVLVQVVFQPADFTLFMKRKQWRDLSTVAPENFAGASEFQKLVSELAKVITRNRTKRAKLKLASEGHGQATPALMAMPAIAGAARMETGAGTMSAVIPVTAHESVAPPRRGKKKPATESGIKTEDLTPIPGFTYLRHETFAVGGQTYTVAVYRYDYFARALGLWAGYTDPACEFVRIPGGKFLMGGRHDDEQPAHEVTLKPFLLARTLVVQTVWDSIVRQGNLKLGDTREWKGARLPMESISHPDAQEFAKVAGLRLPSEAEWEWACRAGSTTEFFFGDNDAELDRFAWFGTNSHQRTREVAKRDPNAFGLFDIVGNVYQWCQDHWHAGYRGAPADGTAWIESKNAAMIDRVCRGGSWRDRATACRSGNRNHYSPTMRSYFVGLRLAASLT